MTDRSGDDDTESTTSAAGDGTDERILRAALEVFAELGYGRATIKRIAEQAEIKSTALLYWYHPSKRDLFDAVVRRFAPVLERIVDADPELPELPPEQFFKRFANAFLATFTVREVQLVFRMMIQEPEILEKARPLAELRPDNVFTFVEDYLRRQVAIGALRDVDPSAVAASYIGQLSAYLQATSGRSPFAPDPPPPGPFVDTMVDLLLRGVRA